MSDELKDVKELKEVMKVLSETVPGLLESIAKVMYGAQEGERMGQAVASFYSALVKSGMSSEQAFKLTREYMSSMSLGGLIQGITKGHRDEEGSPGGGTDDVGKAIKERIKRELEE